MTIDDPARVVRDGYNAVSEQYRDHRSIDSADVRLLDALAGLLPDDAVVLDAGCGSGIPISAKLAERFAVVGLDFAMGQVRLAARSVAGARFVCGDMTRLPFDDASFDGACSYYAIIHIERERHAAVLAELYRVLKPGGAALVCLGANDSPEWREQYLGVPMYWSHFDRRASLALVQKAGFEVLDERVVVDETDRAAAATCSCSRGEGTTAPPGSVRR